MIEEDIEDNISCFRLLSRQESNQVLDEFEVPVKRCNIKEDEDLKNKYKQGQMDEESSEESDPEEEEPAPQPQPQPQPQLKPLERFTSEAVLVDVLMRFFVEGKVVAVDPNFPDACAVFQVFLQRILVQNDGKNGVPVIPGIGWVQKKRKDQKEKKAHSKMCHILDEKYWYLGGIQYLISKYAYSKQCVMHLQAILGSSRNEGLSQISISYLITNEGLCELITDESLILQTLEGLNSQSKADVRNLMEKLTPYFRQGTPDFRNMDTLKERIQKSKEFKKPCTYLENLLCLRSFYHSIFQACSKHDAGTAPGVIASFRAALRLVEDRLKSEDHFNRKPKGEKNHKLVDFESYVKMSS